MSEAWDNLFDDTEDSRGGDNGEEVDDNEVRKL
jgi:hypothetical protein